LTSKQSEDPWNGARSITTYLLQRFRIPEIRILATRSGVTSPSAACASLPFSVFTCQRAWRLSPPRSPRRRRRFNPSPSGEAGLYLSAGSAVNLFFLNRRKFFPAIPRSSSTSPRFPNRRSRLLGRRGFYPSAKPSSTPFFQFHVRAKTLPKTREVG
jgi:hypothetical protein